MAKINHAWRNSLLAKIHIAKKQLPDMDEELYRDTMEDLFGKRSARKLTMRELGNFADYLESKGAEFTHSGKPASKPQDDFYEIPDGTPHAKQKRWIAAMWHALGWKMSGLDKRSKLQLGADKFLWATDQRQLQKVAKDLVNRCKKAGIDPYDAQPTH